MTLAVFGIVALVIVVVLAAHAVAAYALARRMTRIKRVRVTGTPADLYLDHEEPTFPAADRAGAAWVVPRQPGRARLGGDRPR